MAAKDLRYLIGLLHHITNVIEQKMWTIAFEKWYKKHRSFIEEKGIHQPTNRWWYRL